MRNTFILIYISVSSFLFATNPISGDPINTIVNYKGPRTFLVSYPRSGNTLMRYCIEFLTKRLSFHRANHFKEYKNFPVGLNCNFEVDCNKPPFEKIHERNEMNYDGIRYNPAVDKIILIIRNPKEAITRQEGAEITYQMLLGKLTTPSVYYSAKVYFDNIALFDEWPPENRLLIYYEDFMKDPRTTFLRILQFLQEPSLKLEELLSNYEKHKEMALIVYGESKSQGKDTLFHSKKSTPEQRKKIDQWIETLYPKIWKSYLKDHYSEEVLAY